MPIINQKEWDECVHINEDPYGKCCIDVAREVMRILDENKDFDAHKIICDADKNIKAGGITGFMAGCIAQMINHVHSRGEEFNDKWNDLHGVSKEKAAACPDEGRSGTVNPAILTIQEK